MRPRRREPLFNVPTVVVSLLVVLVAIEVGRELLSPAGSIDLLGRFAFAPIRLTAMVDPTRVAAQIATWSTSAIAGDRQKAAFAQFFLASPTPAPFTLLTYALLHGGWLHLGLNSLWLLAFGTPVVRRLGIGRFVVLLAATAVAGALTHWACFPLGAEPVVGASAAVSGCMGAALRFAFRPNARGDRDALAGTTSTPPLSLRDIVKDRRALSFLLVWFVSNALFGQGSVAFGLTDAPVAWQAHVGGFVAGLLLFVVLDPHRRTQMVVPPDGSSSNVSPDDE